MTAATDLREFADMVLARRLFESGTEVAVARAPGRLDVMGGIADYSGSLVLQRPIAEGTCAAVQRIERPALEVISSGRPPFTVAMAALMPRGEPLTYEAARRSFARDDAGWAAYVAGLFLVLARERGIRFDPGVRIVVDSRVPEGKGVSSSAALETAVMQAAAAVFDPTLTARELALLCQRAENLVVGAPCGVMDQMACVFGDVDALMALLCQPAQLQPRVALPADLAVWGIDSGERHAVTGADYGVVRAAAFMGLRILDDHVRVPGGYLANVDPADFERAASLVPEEMIGEAFLSRYGGTSDSVTAVAAGVRYPVRAASAHPVYERQRAETFSRLLQRSFDEAVGVRLGALMYESHASYGRCGLGSRGTDRIVELVRQAGAGAGLYGARITGGGSGGTVAIIGRADASASVARVAEQYGLERGHRPYIFAGSSPGVAAVGVEMICV